MHRGRNGVAQTEACAIAGKPGRLEGMLLRTQRAELQAAAVYAETGTILRMQVMVHHLLQVLVVVFLMIISYIAERGNSVFSLDLFIS
jgi:hypothetical protein